MGSFGNPDFQLNGAALIFIKMWEIRTAQKLTMNFSR